LYQAIELFRLEGHRRCTHDKVTFNNPYLMDAVVMNID